MRNPGIALDAQAKAWLDKHGYKWEAFGKAPFRVYFLGEEHGNREHQAAQTELVSLLKPEYVLLENVDSIYKPTGEVIPLTDANCFLEAAPYQWPWFEEYGATLIGWEPNPVEYSRRKVKESLPTSKKSMIFRNERQAGFARKFATLSDGPIVAITGVDHFKPKYKLQEHLGSLAYVFVDQTEKCGVLNSAGE